ncbi:signal recognition particle, SRP19 subunit [Cryomyces antarcticus]|uniref:Signal recognition particle subunit n=1 Tax=Cryomyces antarcticus TaxID=329879 RepID=A0ABR0M9G4_9PEZI|nr:hypothetical protein LTR04_003256 [Oleoguttula sp. CCFEE 6159]KAK5297019.1 signal recognition particle subunit [Cryomyces antarcticus]
MSRQARIEEISDSDSDPDDMDPSDFDPADIIAPAKIPIRAAAPAPEQLLQPQIRSSQSEATDRERTKHWQCIYPVYFDINRSRAEGRRVGKELAVLNPLAREMVDAVGMLGLNTVFEPAKTHPKDWSNPGRVRILLRENGKQIARNIKNKHHLYNLVSAHLKSHPTTESSPMRLRIAGLPLPSKPAPPPAVPRGWKMGTVLPLHSPALSGGGVSDNFFKDMMAEMQGGEAAGAITGGGGEGKKKKEKKKGKA